jgi:SpoVK/Ycf46/Vps4 family AAA+-type ATPase
MHTPTPTLWPLSACGTAGLTLLSILPSTSHTHPSNGIILIGPSGSGKTCLARAFALSLDSPLIRVTAVALRAAYPGAEIARGIETAFSRAACAASLSPSGASVLFFDDADVTFRDTDDGGDGKRLAADARRALARGRRAAAQAAHEASAVSESTASTSTKSAPIVWLIAAVSDTHAARNLFRGVSPLFIVLGNVGGEALAAEVAILRASGRVSSASSSSSLITWPTALATAASAAGPSLRAGDVAALIRETFNFIGETNDDQILLSSLSRIASNHLPLALICGGGGGGVNNVATNNSSSKCYSALARATATAAVGGFLPAALIAIDDYRSTALRTAVNNHLPAHRTPSGGWRGRGWGAAADNNSDDTGRGRGGRNGPPQSLGVGGVATGLAAALRAAPAEAAWSDVVGADAAAAEIRIVMRASAVAAEAGAKGVTPPVWAQAAPNGILLFGPPGTGKTLIARAAANDLGARFVNVPIPAIISAGVGDSERALASAFAAARGAAPSVLFFDEIDALFPRKEGGGSGGRLAATLTFALCSLLDSARGAGIIVLAATNSPASLDVSLFSPGRFDRVIHVGLPDCAARVALMEHALNKLPPDSPAYQNRVTIAREIGAITDRFSGADLATLIGRSASAALFRSGVSARISASFFKEEEEGGEEEGGEDDVDSEEDDSGGEEDDSEECLGGFAIERRDLMTALFGDNAAGLLPLTPSVSENAAKQLAKWRP